MRFRELFTSTLHWEVYCFQNNVGRDCRPCRADGEPVLLDVALLVNDLMETIRATSAPRQFWLGIAGPPGSGKSTLTMALLRELPSCTIAIPMDGYHFTRAELDGMDDPEEAHRRRGAPFTFDAQQFVEDVQRSRLSGDGEFPSFDHGRGDPVQSDIILSRERHRLVIVEGNYLLLNETPWCRIRDLLDETWYLNVDPEICKQRVRNRFLATGRDEATANFRVAYNDGPNGELVARESPANADRILTG